MILPIQTLSRAEKLERNPQTNKNNIEETIDYYIEQCGWGTYTSEIYELYAAVEGELNENDYRLLKNPYNKQKDDNTPLQFNAELKNFNILKGVVNLLMGEFGKRVHEYVVTTINDSDEFAYKDGLNIIIKNYYSQVIANHLYEIGLDLGQQVQEVGDLESYTKEFENTFEETRIISGQEILDFIKYNCNLDDKYIDLYYDWIVTGGFATYKKVNHDDVYFEVVPRHELYVPNENHSRYIEDMSFAVRRQILPVFKIIDLFRGRIEEEVVQALEQELLSGLTTQYSTTFLTGRQGAVHLPTMYVTGSTYKNMYTTQNGVELFHVVYTTFRKYGELTYESGFGEKVMEVGDDYVLNKDLGDISIEWKWENIKYEGYRCLNYYLDCGELKENRADLNQNGLQKLPYNGIHERTYTGKIQSIVKEGLPYQRSINSLKYNIEKLINKNKDKVIVMPYGIVPRKKGIDTKTQAYHMDATSILWVDETAPNAQLAAQMIKVLDVSLGSYIKDTYGLIQLTRQEFWDVIGMNSQRYSDIGVSAGKAVTEQAIQRSSTITYELTRQFDKVVEKDYQGLLDISKLAFINGKKGKYIRPDGSIAFLNMNQDNSAYHSENSYGVFVKNASDMTEAIQAMRGQAVNLIQNGANNSVLGHLFSTNNVTKLTKILEKMDKNKQELDQLLQKQKDDANMALQDKINANDELNRELEKYKVDKAYDSAIESARIRSDRDTSRDSAKPESDLERELAQHKINKENRELNLKQQQISNNKSNNKSN